MESLNETLGEKSNIPISIINKLESNLHLFLKL